MKRPNELALFWAALARRDIVAWAEANYYIADTAAPIVLAPHQKAILRFVTRWQQDGSLPFNYVIYSSIKKSGKTEVSGLVTRWAAETWGRYGEILCVGNDAKQAEERGFAALVRSIELTPGYRRPRKLLPGRWEHTDRQARCLTTGTIVKAIATDYKGEAGGNPIMTVYTELWGFIDRASKRFWAEMAPSPTKPASIRWIETYAGYEGESELLETLHRTAVTNGRQMRAGELGDVGCFEEASKPDDPIPCYINEAAGTFAYWDTGTAARRMPWQKGPRAERYYREEANTQTDAQFRRLHFNQWVNAESSFIPIETWDACVDPAPLTPGDKTPLVLALDAAVSGDCFGLVVVSRDPKNVAEGIAVRGVDVWTPEPGRKLDFAGPEARVRWWCQNHNVVEVAYDPYQLHDFATRLMKAGVAWFREFSQGQERLESDSDLQKYIIHRRIRHDGNRELRQHLQNANAKMQSDQDSKLRMVKKAEHFKIDLAVALSMAARECLRLNLT